MPELARVYSLLKYIEYGVFGDLIIRYPEAYSVYLRGTIGFRVLGWLRWSFYSVAMVPEGHFRMLEVCWRGGCQFLVLAWRVVGT